MEYDNSFYDEIRFFRDKRGPLIFIFYQVFHYQRKGKCFLLKKFHLSSENSIYSDNEMSKELLMFTIELYTIVISQTLLEA